MLFPRLLLAAACFASSLACVPGIRYHPKDAATIAEQQQQQDVVRDVVVVEASARLENTTNCGRKGGDRRVKPHVVGGQVDFPHLPWFPAVLQVARENELPWHVALLKDYDGWHGCSATLLSCSPPIVVTAAHCVENSKPSELRLGLGAHQLAGGRPSPLDSSEVRLAVSEIIVHPGYSSYVARIGKIKVKKEKSKRNKKIMKKQGRFLFDTLNITIFEDDIALLKVKEPELLQCSQQTIWPACLPHQDYDYSGWERTILSGWGRIAEAGTWSRFLKRARVPIVSDRQCEQNLFHYNQGGFDDIPFLPFTISNKQLCAGQVRLSVRTQQWWECAAVRRGGCQGDSGGPLVAQDDGQPGQGWSLVGVVSWGLTAAVPGGGCGNDRYTVFTEVGQYLPWIAEQYNLLPPA